MKSNIIKMVIAKVLNSIDHILLYHGNINLFMIKMKYILLIVILLHIQILIITF